MAGLKNNILGELRGKIGGVVAKVRNGKQYIASLPSQYTMSKAPHEVDKRNRFRVNGKFAGGIKASDILYGIWNINKKPAVNAWNKICMVNFRLCDTGRPSDKNVITPGGFNLAVTDVSELPGGMEVDLDSFTILNNENRVIFIMIICFYNPQKKVLPPFVMSKLDNYEVDDMKLTFSYTSIDKKTAADYNNRVIYLAAVTEDENGGILRWSGTYSKEL